MSDILKGKLGYKGEPGLSAYEVAVKNGFSGTEQEWLATLGTTNHFEQTKTIVSVSQVGTDEIAIPNSYVSGSSFLDIYVNGQRLNSNEYSLDLTNRVIELVNPLNTIGTKVELVMVTISTNNLPIVEHIDSTSTNNTTPGTKAVYDYVSDVMEAKVDYSKFIQITGTIPVMETNSTITISVDYPTGLSKSNLVILEKSVLSNGIYVSSENPDGALAPVIKSAKLTDESIVLAVSLGSSEVNQQSTYRLSIMKVGD